MTKVHADYRYVYCHALIHSFSECLLINYVVTGRNVGLGLLDLIFFFFKEKLVIQIFVQNAPIFKCEHKFKKF